MWFLICVVCLISRIQVHSADGDIEHCVPNEETAEGRCVPLTDCAPAFRLVSEKKVKHPYSRCGFEGFTEIVCCPTAEVARNKYGDDNSTADAGKGDGPRVADIECQKIKNVVDGIVSLYIIGGEDVSPGEFPHMVALGYGSDDRYEFNCGGSLVSESFVLTAAHCAGTRLESAPSIARVGTVDIADAAFNSDTDVRVAEVRVHPQRTPATKYHDIALLRLERPVKISEVASPVCLHTAPEEPRVPLTATGWGQTTISKRVANITLQKASLSYVDRSTCGESYKISGKYWLKLPNGVISEQLCAHHPQGLTDACQGDSGGPLQMLSADNFYRLVGVTSFGIGCGTSKPGIYTRVYPYLDWIESVVWPR